MVSDYETVLIDEPEIGLNPKLQNALASTLFDSGERAKLFPPDKTFVICTHSHVFLDRANIQNNFWLDRQGKHVTVRQIRSMSEWHALQLKLLGNDLRSLFLPEAIVLVEGPSEQLFLEACFGIEFPDRRIAVLDCKTETEIPKRLDDLKATFGGIEKSPYTGRVFCVFDSQHQTHIGKLTTRGVLPKHVAIWDNNGIEFVYPDRTLSEIYATSDRSQLRLEGNHVRCNEQSFKKTELAGKVARMLRSGEEWPDELRDKLLAPIRTAIE